MSSNQPKIAEAKHILGGQKLDAPARVAFDREKLIRKLIRGIPVRRNSYQQFVRWLKRDPQSANQVISFGDLHYRVDSRTSHSGCEHVGLGKHDLNVLSLDYSQCHTDFMLWRKNRLCMCRRGYRSAAV